MMHEVDDRVVAKPESAGLGAQAQVAVHRRAVRIVIDVDRGLDDQPLPRHPLVGRIGGLMMNTKSLGVSTV
jgi:hypothetical protein